MPASEEIHAASSPPFAPAGQRESFVSQSHDFPVKLGRKLADMNRVVSHGVQPALPKASHGNFLLA